MRSRLAAIVGSLLIPTFLSSGAEACGSETDCRIGDRIYRITLPETLPANERIGAIIYAHGYRGRAERVMQNKSMKLMANELGVAFIAAQSAGEDWSIPGAPSKSVVPGVDEIAYFGAVIDDATGRFPIDRDRMLVTGFSAGGMMVWNLACFGGDLFAGFAPMAGTFWRPEPEACPDAPVNLFHYHGTNDPIVPLQGRPIADTHQGDVLRVADLLVQEGGYADAGEAPDAQGLDCDRFAAVEDATDALKVFDFCLHDGQHEFKVAYVRRAWMQLEALDAF